MVERVALLLEARQDALGIDGSEDVSYPPSRAWPDRACTMAVVVLAEAWSTRKRIGRRTGKVCLSVGRISPRI
jgi:hypothetical protein